MVLYWKVSVMHQRHLGGEVGLALVGGPLLLQLVEGLEFRVQARGTSLIRTPLPLGPP